MINYEEFKNDFSDLMVKYPEMKMYFIGMSINSKEKPLGIRINNGYNAYELLGIVEELRASIVKQLSGEDSPIAIDKYFVVKED